MKKSPWPQIIFSAVALAGSGVTALITRGSMEHYYTLNLPPASPPGWVFPVVWSVLYILMGIAMGIVWSKSSGSPRKRSLSIWGVQLLVNLLWPIFYFKLEWRLFSFCWLAALFVLVLGMISQFSRTSDAAARLNVPYALWLCFAGYLNMATYLLNG